MRNTLELIVPLCVAVVVSSGPGCSSSSNTSSPNDAGTDQTAEDSGMQEDTGSMMAETGAQDSPTSNDTGAPVDTGVIDASWKDAGNDGGVTDATTDGSDGAVFCAPVTTLPTPPQADAGAFGITCPYSGVDGGVTNACSPGSEHCCESTTNQTGSCDPIGTACPSGAGNLDWQCIDPVSNCGGGTPVCCAAGATLVLGGTGCGNYATGLTATTCAATCTGITLCTSNSECPNGMTCTPFSVGGNPVGACM
jgi:hypothetical protein